MNEANEILDAVESFLLKHGFTVQRELSVVGTRFDIIAEDDMKLVFVEFHSSNRRWLDDFYDRQAGLATLVSSLRLGQKWRDVYLIEITTDPVDSLLEAAAVEEIQSNTAAARKLVVDASQIDLLDEAQLARVFSPLLSGPRRVTPQAEIDVLQHLADYLVREGFESEVISKLIRSFGTAEHDCVDIVLKEAK